MSPNSEITEPVASLRVINSFNSLREISGRYESSDGCVIVLCRASSKTRYQEPVPHNAVLGESGFAKVDDHRLCQAFGLQDHVQGATSYPDCPYGKRGALQTQENHEAEEKA